jgi:hypothetical protein
MVPDMENGTFVKWLVDVGDEIEHGTPLFVVSADACSRAHTHYHVCPSTGTLLVWCRWKPPSKTAIRARCTSNSAPNAVHAASHKVFGGRQTCNIADRVAGRGGESHACAIIVYEPATHRCPITCALQGVLARQFATPGQAFSADFPVGTCLATNLRPGKLMLSFLDVF